MEIEIDAETRLMLDFGDKVISWVKEILPFGAGNQFLNVALTQGASRIRTAGAQSAYGPDWDRPLRNAGATITYKSGNCQDQAAVVYAVLREALPSGYKACFMVCRNLKHSFSGFYKIGSNRGIVVDSWPIFAQALRYEDHFCDGADLQVLREKDCGVPGKLNKAISKYSGICVSNPVSDPNAWRQAEYDVRWGSKCQGKVEYIEMMDTSD